MSKLDLFKREKETVITYDQRELFRWSENSPVLFVGKGKENVEMYRGNFKIEDYLIERVPLIPAKIEEKENEISIMFAYKGELEPFIEIDFSINSQGRLILQLRTKNSEFNRLWLRVSATKNEKIYGCGEQLSHFNLRGYHFPLWTSEPGVGRNKDTYITWQADVKDRAGGDYYTTNYPQQTFVSTKKYYCHADSFAYADFDFRNDSFHELQFWEIPKKITFETGESYIELLEKLTNLLGRQQILPDWTREGMILGVQGGTEMMENTVEKMRNNGVKIGGVFCQDWQGIRITDFGKRLFWNWEWNPQVYPELDTKIEQWKEKGINFMGYVNPYLCNDGELFKVADELGYFAKNKAGETYIVDFGQFYCGIIDFTNPKAYKWFKELIQKNLIDFGLKGWMADFGEYLPTDVVLFDDSDPMIRHNEWPALWAKCNFDAIKDSGKLGEIVYFMRAGATGSQKYSTLMWAGDQSVDWSLDDGLASVIPGTLAMGMSGCGLNHSDIGGYTSLHGNIRTEELFMRWAEMAAFTPFMRSHEGNRPSENFQIYNSEKAMKHLSIFTDIFVNIAEYTKEVIIENAETGTPAQRALFLHYEDDDRTYDIQYEYLFGRDILVAPVHEQGQNNWDVYLPNDHWVHMWSGKEYCGGDITVDAPLGQPPVFYRKNSRVGDILRKYQL